MIRALALAMGVAIPIHAQTASVHGLAFDSLRGLPLAGALVTIEGTTLSAVSDRRGAFEILNVPRGPQRLVLQHDVLDSVGYAGRARPVNVDGSSTPVVLGTPSFATIWNSACRGLRVPPDSGLVYGFVRAAGDRRPVDSATVAIAWRDVSYASATGFDERQWGGSVTSGANGLYAVCGTPVNATVRVIGVRDSMASDRIDVMVSSLRVARRDLTLASSARGYVSGALSGDEGQPLVGAVIVAAGVPESHSDDDGRFVLRDVPAGTRQIEVRAIGAEPSIAAVDVPPGDTAFVTMTLRKVVTLPQVQVTGRTVRQALARGIEERRQLGLGLFRDSIEIARLPDPASIFDGIAGVTVRRAPAHRFNVRHASCDLSVFIDRVRLEPIDFALLRNRDIAAVEVYTRNVPIEFAGRGVCGAIVVWTKRLLDQNWTP